MTDLRAAFEKAGLPGASVAFAAACHDLARLALNKQSDPTRAVHTWLGMASGTGFRDALLVFLGDVAKEREANSSGDVAQSLSVAHLAAGPLPLEPNSTDDMAHAGTVAREFSSSPSVELTSVGEAAHSVTVAHAPGGPSPAGPSPGFVRALVAAGGRQAAVMSGFYITERQGSRTPLEEIRVDSLARRREWLGKRAAGSAVEYNVLWLLEQQARKQAFIPKGALLPDVFGADDLRQTIAMGRAFATSPMIQLPEALRSDAGAAA